MMTRSEDNRKESPLDEQTASPKKVGNKSRGLTFVQHLDTAKVLLEIDRGVSKLRPKLCSHFAPGSQIAVQTVRAQRALRRLRLALDHEVQTQYCWRASDQVYFPNVGQDKQEPESV